MRKSTLPIFLQFRPSATKGDKQREGVTDDDEG